MGLLRGLAVAGGFSLLVLATQVVWVTFSPVASSVALELGVSPWHIGFLATLFPLIYIAVAIPSGRLLDTRFRLALLLGALLTVFGGAGRLIAYRDYGWLLACQIAAAVGQPFVINAIAPFASRYFLEGSRAVVIGVSSAAMYLGVVAAMAVGEHLYHAGGLWLLVLVPALLAAVSGAWLTAILALAKPVGSDGQGHTLTLEALRMLARRTDLWMLSILLGMGLGVYDILVSWLEPVLNAMGLKGLAGSLLASSILAGIVGSALLPGVAYRLGARTLMFRVIAGTLVATYLALPYLPAEAYLPVFIVQGFLLLAGFPLIIEWIESTLPVSLQGQATGFVMLVSHLLAIAVIYPAGGLIEAPYTFFTFLAGLGAVALAATLLLPRR